MLYWPPGASAQMLRGQLCFGAASVSLLLVPLGRLVWEILETGHVSEALSSTTVPGCAPGAALGLVPPHPSDSQPWTWLPVCEEGGG